MSVTIRWFDLQPGRKIAGKYEVVSVLGMGWQGEVYKIREVQTGIERATKVFFTRAATLKTGLLFTSKLHV